MNIRIGLTREDYDCLFAKVATESPLRCVFEPQKEEDGVGCINLTSGPGLPLGDDVIMWCRTEDAGELLKIAVAECPDAAYAIRRALRGRP